MMARLLAAATLALLSACAATPVHRGLSSDGYGFADHSPHVPPPADLEQAPASKDTPGP